MENERIKILAIDDNVDNLYVLQDLIEGGTFYEGVDTILATSAKEGLALAEVSDPDVILLNILTPGMDGCEICRTLKSNPDLFHIPVIFLTAPDEETENRIRGLEVGGEVFLSKPINQSELVAQVRAMVRIKKAAVKNKNENERLLALVVERTQQLQQTHLATLNLLEDLKTENLVRRQTEEALRASEELYRSVIQASPDNISVTDLTGNFQMVSPKGLHLFGCTSESDLLGKNIKDFILPEQRERAELSIARLFNDEKHGAEEYIICRSDESMVAVEVTAEFVRDNTTGKPLRMVFSIRDITERKIARQALLESEEKYRSLVENSTNGIMVYDEQVKLVYINNSMVHILGAKSEDEILGKCLHDMVPHDLLPFFEKKVKMIFEQGMGPTSYETRFLRIDGTEFIAEVTSIPAVYSHRRARQVIVRDITASRMAQQSLEESENRYNTFINNNADLIFVKDESFRYLVANHALAAFYGKTVPEVLGKTDDELIGVNEVNVCKISDAAVFETGLPITVEEVFGDQVYETTKFPMELTGGRKGVGGIIHNITKRKTAEKRASYVSRLYAFLSQVNQSIVRISKEEDLFHSICRLAVEYGHFRMCWIGVFNPVDESIRPVAYAGHIDGYLDGVNIRPFTLPFGQGPTGQAFVCNKRVFCNNIETDPMMAPWREQALDRGYKSSFATPIFRNEVSYGVLTLYASETDFFKEEEQELLQEIGKNLSFAIDAIDSEEQRSQMDLALKQSRAELRAIYDNAPVMMCLVNKEREVLFTNPAFDNFTNAFASHSFEGESTGNRLGDILECLGSVNGMYGCGSGIDCQDCQLRKAVVDTFNRKQGYTNLEYHNVVTRVDGGKQDVYLLVSTAFIQTVNEPTLLVCLSDITDRKVAEEAMQKSETLLRAFIDNNPFEIWARDNNLLGILENQKTVERIGSIIGKTPQKHDHPNVSEKMKKNWVQKSIRTLKGEVVHDESMTQIKNKQYFFQETWFPIVTSGKIVGIAGFNIDITDRKLNEAALRESREEIKKFAVHLQNIREEERSLLAREIHDELGQILVAMKIDMGMLKQEVQKKIQSQSLEEVLQKFTALMSLLDTTIKTARRIMTNLRPEVLDLLGFEDTVKQYLDSYQERFKIASNFHSTAGKLELDSQKSVALFRIIQEALNNIAKHAKASEVNVFLSRQHNKLVLEVIDDGVGFDMKSKKRNDSYGLIGMKERVYLLEGELYIHSSPGNGTKVKVELPLT